MIFSQVDFEFVTDLTYDNLPKQENKEKEDLIGENWKNVHLLYLVRPSLYCFPIKQNILMCYFKAVLFFMLTTNILYDPYIWLSLIIKKIIR